MALAAGSALAQQPVADQAELQVVRVTGSRISGSDIESLLQVQVVGRDDVLRSGATTTAALIATVPANLLGSNDQTGVAQLTPGGLASANLRGIGEESTLVLLDGRRVSNYAFAGDTVDLNSIPLSALERVEILKDGASAIYGSDAVAGVINFVLRKDFQGLEASAQGDWTEHGGGEQRQSSLSIGSGSVATDRFNVFATLSYQTDAALPAVDRSFARTGYLPDEGVLLLSSPTFPASIQTGPRTIVNPTFATGCSPPDAIPFRFPFVSDVPICGYDFTRTIDILPSVERSGAVGRATFEVNPHSQVFAQLFFSRNRFIFTDSPAPVYQGNTSNHEPVIYPAGGPYYPSAFAAANGISGDLNLRYRTVPLGPQRSGTDTMALQGVVGAEGILGGWDYDTALTYSNNQQTSRFLSGVVSQQRLLAALATGLINPFGDSGPAGMALLEGAQIIGDSGRGHGYTLEFDAKTSRSVYPLPGGPLALAFGGEARREHLENTLLPAFAENVGGLGNQGSVAGSRTAEALFAEASIPLFPSWESQIAVRYDHYGDFGGTLNPKIALRWQPTKALQVRASGGTGYRAPALYDLYSPVTTGVAFGDSLRDPVRCPITGHPEDCGGTFRVVSGGNPNLKPEKSRQFDAGLVLRPTTSISLTADYWKIAKDGEIGSLDPATLFGQFGRYAPNYIVRGPVEPNFPNLPGPITTLLLNLQNLGSLRTSGVDVNVTAGPWTTAVGSIQFSLDGTYLLQWKRQFDGNPYASVLGNDISGPVPRWKHRATFDWLYADWGATLSQSLQSGYIDANVDRLGTPLDVPPRRVASYLLTDIQVRYAGFRHVALALGVRNLMDSAPPFSNQPYTRQVGFDPNYADPRLRAFYARVSYTFD
jgi:iron complex outermembrane receptor protein